jgi:hypothetical protein
LISEPGLHPGNVPLLRDAEAGGGTRRRNAPAIVPPGWHRSVVRECLPILRQKGIEVYEMVDPGRGRLGYPGDDHAAVAVADQHHVLQILELEYRYYIRGVGVEIDLRLEEMRSFSQSGERGCDDIMAGGTE